MSWLNLLVAPAAPAAPAAPVDAPTPPAPRYPKRKRAEAPKYNVDDISDASTDSEFETVPIKRPRHRPFRPLPKHKVFPFLSLPAELRNRIYEACLPPPTKLPPDFDDGEPTIWFTNKQKRHRRTVEYIPEVTEEMHEMLFDHYRYVRRHMHGTARGTGSRRPPTTHPTDAASDSDASDDDPATTSTPAHSLALNLLATCKQVYAEAAPMLYRRRLVFTDLDALFNFSARLSPGTAKMLRYVEIRNWFQTRSRKNRGWAAMAMLAAKGVTDLEVLHVNCQVAYFHSYRSWRGNSRKETPVPKRVARKIYRDCHFWLEAVGVASGDYLRGVDVLRLKGGEHFKNWGGDEWTERGEDLGERAMKVYKKELRMLLSREAW